LSAGKIAFLERANFPAIEPFYTVSTLNVAQCIKSDNFNRPSWKLQKNQYLGMLVANLSGYRY
jgi:hypothetical protein